MVDKILPGLPAPPARFPAHLVTLVCQRRLSLSIRTDTLVHHSSSLLWQRQQQQQHLRTEFWMDSLPSPFLPFPLFARIILPLDSHFLRSLFPPLENIRLPFWLSRKDERGQGIQSYSWIILDGDAKCRTGNNGLKRPHWPDAELPVIPLPAQHSASPPGTLR